MASIEVENQSSFDGSTLCLDLHQTSCIVVANIGMVGVVIDFFLIKITVLYEKIKLFGYEYSKQKCDKCRPAQ